MMSLAIIAIVVFLGAFVAPMFHTEKPSGEISNTPTVTPSHRQTNRPRLTIGQRNNRPRKSAKSKMHIRRERQRQTKLRPTVLVCVDFDGTFASVPDPDITQFDQKRSSPIKYVVDAIKDHIAAGTKVVILTGRPTYLSKKIREFVEMHIGFKVEVLCNKFNSGGHNQKSTLRHKTDTLNRLLKEHPGIKKVVYYEDDLATLRACVKIAEHQGILYYGHHIVNGKMGQLVTKPTNPLIVALVDINEDQTKKIIGIVHKELLKEMEVGFISRETICDEIKKTNRMCTNSEIHTGYQKAIRRACAMYELVMTPDPVSNGDHRKGLTSIANVLLATVVPIAYHSVKGKTVSEIHPTYIASGHIKGLTAEADQNKVSLIAQIHNPSNKVVSLASADGSALSNEEYAMMLVQVVRAHRSGECAQSAHMTST
jgi:hydroxymethylpyrimidine pyrophosphatase-like HAD family hydrolase